MKNIHHECSQCINREKCFTCENKSNFIPAETEKHINKFFFGLFGILFAIVLFLITTKLLMCKQPKEQVISIPTDTTFTVTASVYHACKAQCDNTYWITAFNYKIDTLHPDKHRFIAISRDIEKTIIDKDTVVNFRGGDTVIVSGTWVYDGLWIVGDRMKKTKTMQIDFLIAKGQYEHKWKDITIKKY